MADNFENYPRLQQVKESIEKLKTNGFPKYTEEETVSGFVKRISDLLTQEFQILPNVFSLFEPKSFNLNIFRARELDSFSNVNLFSEHSFPPTNVVGFGRCNFPNYPVFYCSNDPMTALIEVVRDKGKQRKKYCISKWEIIDSDEEFIFQSFLQSDLAEENQFNALKEGLKKRINEPFKNGLDEDQEKGILEYLRFLDSLFINDNEYGVSASLAHRALYPEHNLSTDILMYPSIQTQTKGVNMAIHPNFVGNHLRAQRFYILEFEHYKPNTGKIKVSFSAYGSVEKNVIMWKNILPDDITYQQHIREDFGHLMDSDFRFVFEK